jgi:CBS domain-containing protein
MNVSEIMAAVVQMVRPEDNLGTVARVMKKFDIGCVLVGSNHGVVGIVTDRDLVLRGLSAGDEACSMSVAEVMTPDPMFCTTDDTVRQAAIIMQHNLVRRLPVLNADRTVAGIVSLGDICCNTPSNLAGQLIAELSRPRKHSLAEAG